MQLADLLPKIVNLDEIERIVGKPLRTMDAIHDSGYHLVKARDRDEYYLAKETDLQPLLVRQGDAAEVRFGIKTGANEFFYLEPVNRRVVDVIGDKVGATVRVKVVGGVPRGGGVGAYSVGEGAECVGRIARINGLWARF